MNIPPSLIVIGSAVSKKEINNRQHPSFFLHIWTSLFLLCTSDQRKTTNWRDPTVSKMLSVFNLLFWNHRTNLNQTWYEYSLDCPLKNLVDQQYLKETRGPKVTNMLSLLKVTLNTIILTFKNRRTPFWHLWLSCFFCVPMINNRTIQW
jgi:hypothetical protein